MKESGTPAYTWKHFGTLLIALTVTLSTLGLLHYWSAGFYYAAHPISFSAWLWSIYGGGSLICTVLFFIVSVAAVYMKKRESQGEEPRALLLIASGIWVIAGIVLEVLLVAMVQYIRYR